MKTFVIFLFLLFIFQNGISQKMNLSELNIDQLNLYKEKAVNMRNTGVLLTLVGGTVYTTGFSLLLNYMNKTPILDWADDPEPNFYAILTICGGAAGIAGIPIWIIGGTRKTKAEIALKKFDIKKDNSTAFGFGLTLRF